MILIDRPYVSDFVFETARKHDIPIIATPAADLWKDNGCGCFVTEQEAIRRLHNGNADRILTVSEHALDWIETHLSDTALPDVVRCFKNKLRFRELLKDHYPGLSFAAYRLDELEQTPADMLTFPFVIKPAVGFFSVGVQRISTPEQWERVRHHIRRSLISENPGLPETVLDGSVMLMESVIDGEELAFDAYFDQSGEPVVLNVFQHLFSSDSDVSDRVYISSTDIVEEHLKNATAFLEMLAERLPLRNFPVHVEVRLDKTGRMVPIEVNPMRFGGWCTTADMTAVSYGFNPYHFYFHNRRPDWKQIFQNHRERVYSIIVLDNSTGIPGSEIQSFDYEGLCATLSRPLEVRRVDYRRHPVFGFIFAETPTAKLNELVHLLHSDLSEFVC